METKSYIQAQAINCNHTTHLRGIIRIENDYFYMNGNAVSNGTFVIHVHSHILVTDYYTLKVEYDQKGVLRLSRTGLNRSKRAFNEACYNLFYDHVEIEKASDAYKQRTWAVLRQCVAAHVSAGEYSSVFDIVKDDNDEGIHISRIPAGTKKKITITVNDRFLFEDDKVKFRVHAKIEDSTRNVCFSGTFMMEASNRRNLEPSSLDALFMFKYAAQVDIAILRMAALQALESPSKAHTLQIERSAEHEVPARYFDANDGYLQIVNYLHTCLLQAAC